MLWLFALLSLVSPLSAEAPPGTPFVNFPRYEAEIYGYRILGFWDLTEDSVKEDIAQLRWVDEFSVYDYNHKTFHPAGAWTYTDGEWKRGPTAIPDEGGTSSLIFFKQRKSARPIRSVPFPFDKYRAILRAKTEQAPDYDDKGQLVPLTTEPAIEFVDAFDLSGDKHADLVAVKINHYGGLFYVDDKSQWFLVGQLMGGC